MHSNVRHMSDAGRPIHLQRLTTRLLSARTSACREHRSRKRLIDSEAIARDAVAVEVTRALIVRVLREEVGNCARRRGRIKACWS